MVFSRRENQMRILVSGSHGLVGKALISSLRSDSHEIVRLVRGKPSIATEIEWHPNHSCVAGLYREHGGPFFIRRPGSARGYFRVRLRFARLGRGRTLQVIQPTNMLSRPSLHGSRYWNRPAQFISCGAVHMSYTTRYLLRVRKYT